MRQSKCARSFDGKWGNKKKRKEEKGRAQNKKRGKETHLTSAKTGRCSNIPLMNSMAPASFFRHDLTFTTLHKTAWNGIKQHSGDQWKMLSNDENRVKPESKQNTCNFLTIKTSKGKHSANMHRGASIGTRGSSGSSRRHRHDYRHRRSRMKCVLSQCSM